MELFEAYEGPSIHDILRESLDDEMDIMRAMHNYEMKSIYMEAVEKIDEDELEDEIEAELEALMVEEEIVTEGQNKEAKKIKKEYAKEAAQLAKEAKKMMKSGDYKGAKANYTKAAKLMRDVAKEIDKLDQSWGAAVLASWANAIKTVAKGILLAIPTLGLGFLYQEVKYFIEVLSMTVNAVNKVRAGKELTPNDFNMHVKKLKDTAEKIAKNYDKLAQECGKMKSGVKESFGPETDVLMESAGDVFNRLKIAVKQFFDKVLAWLKNTVDSVLHNAKSYKKFADEHAGNLALADIKGHIVPDGYKVYEYNGRELSSRLYEVSADKVAADARAAAKGDVDALERIRFGVETHVIARRQTLADTTAIQDKNDKQFIDELKKSFRGREIDKLDKTDLTSLRSYLQYNYEKDIKEYDNARKAVNDEYKKALKVISDVENEIRKQESSSQEAIKAVNAFWTECKRGQSDMMKTVQVFREISSEHAAVAKKAIIQALKESKSK